MDKKNILIITDQDLYPIAHGSQRRIISLIKSLQYLGFSVILINKRFKNTEINIKHKSLADHCILVNAKGFDKGSPFNCDCSPFYPALKEAVAKFTPIAVIVEYIWMTPCLDKAPDSIIKMVDTHDLMHVRKDIYSKNSGAWVICSKEEEAGLLRKADIIIAIQKNEKKKFEKMIHDKKVICLPHYSDLNLRSLNKQNGEEVVMFVGSKSQHNILGANNFLKISWPVIKEQCPRAKFRIYGQVANYISESFEKVEKIGFVNELEQAYSESKTIINPVTIGTGLKIKSVEALCFGKALVTTLHGADGIEEGAGKAFIVEDDMERFGEEVVRLLKDDNYRKSLERNALEFTKNNFSREAVFKEFLEVLK